MECAPVLPFVSAEAAWFWTIRTLQAAAIRSARQANASHPRPDDVIKCLDILYRQRRIELLHVRILRIWGLRGTAPNPARMRERSDWRIWHEAMTRLDAALRTKGIVGGSTFQDAAD